MPNKSLRILIADSDTEQALKIDRALNLAGYHRVAPLRAVDALKGLREAKPGEFDLLLISQKMAGGPAVDAAQYHRDNAQFRHIRIYQDADALAANIVELMQSIDPPQRP